MFDFKQIVLKNFRSFRGEHSFVFPTEAGLYNLTGKNLDNERLDANGIGKSTFLDSIYWCLYGTTIRGLRGGDVITWGETTVSVELTLIVGDDTSIIKRTQAPNSLTLNGKPCDQDQINKYVRMTPKAFLYAVIVPQFGESFLDLAPTAKLTLFSQIMGLEYWLDKSKEASELAGSIEWTISSLEKDLAKVTGRAEAINETLQNLKLEQYSFDDKKKKNIEKYVKELEEKIRAVAPLDKSITEASAWAKQAHGKFQKAEFQISTIEADLKVVRDGEKRLISEISASKANEASLEAQLKKIDGLDKVCPTCHQQVDEEHISSERSKMECKLDTLISFRKKVELEKAGNVKKQEGFSKQLSSLRVDLATINRNEKDFIEQQRQFEKNKQRLQMEIEWLEKTCEDVRAETNPYIGQIESKESDLKEAQALKKHYKKEIENNQSELLAVTYWVTGFKRVRLFLIDEALQQLEIEVNNSLSSLGLVGWEIKFDVERENKSGGVTKGFVAQIYAPGRSEPEKFEAWSGGESQRLILATSFGLANLIMQQAGLSNIVEFFDEPSKHMTYSGRMDMTEALHHRAIKSGKKIYLVDHNTIDFGDFKGTVTVIKDSDGSKITC